MRLSTFLKSLFGSKQSVRKSEDTSDYLTNNPDKKLKVRTIDATRDIPKPTTNSVKKSTVKATKSATKAKKSKIETFETSLEMNNG